MRIAVLAGGIGGARFLRGVRAYAAGAAEPTEITAIVNVGDDVRLHGLHICPDLDSVMYALGEGADEQRGWGRAGETWVVRQELAEYGAQPDWFGLGDKDLATHLVRTQMLDAGHPLSTVTTRLCQRWQPGVHLLPATDQMLQTYVVVDDPRATGDRRAVHFQQWWVRHRAQPAAYRFVFIGASAATPAPGVIEALADADVIMLAPSNPVVSIGPILAIPAIRAAVTAAGAPVVGVSPIINGAPVRGMADRCLAAIGVECTAQAVAAHYGARRCGGVLDGWLVDQSDPAGPLDGMAVGRTPLWMTDDATTRAMVRAALELVGAIA